MAVNVDRLRAVGGPAADIDDQNPLLFTEGGFEIQPGGHRFKLEDHIAETGAKGGPLKDPLRLGVGFVAAEALEVDRPAYHRLVDLLGQLAFRLQLDVQHHGADQVFKQGHLLRLEAAGAEEGLWRFDEVDLFRIFNILMQGGEAELYAVAQHLDVFVAVGGDGPAQQRLVFVAVGRHLVMAIEPLADRFARRRAEHGGQQRAAVFQRQQLGLVFPHHGHRTVGGAVVKTNKHRLQNPHAGEEGGRL